MLASGFACGLNATEASRIRRPLLRATADLSWEQAITLEEFAEPGCFTTRAHRDAVQALVSQA
jgi:2-(1,2-epoxy-1,2-dihydrophenyl)acetyl-CoA isomerase